MQKYDGIGRLAALEEADGKVLARYAYSAAGSVSGGVTAGILSAAANDKIGEARTWSNIALSSLISLGGALLGSGSYLGAFSKGKILPIETNALGPSNTYNMTQYGNGQQFINYTGNFNAFAGATGNNPVFLNYVPPGDFAATARSMINANINPFIHNTLPAANIVAAHGIGRFAIPYNYNTGLMQPMRGRAFAQQIAPLIPNNGLPIKMYTCFSALPPFAGGVARNVNQVTGRITYGTRSITYPKTTTQWVRYG